MWFLWLFVASYMAALAYRAGGIGKPFNTKYRDLGVPLICLLYVLFQLYLPVVWWVHVISFVLLFGSLCTYWDKIFGYDNFYMHGFMCGLSYMPYALVTGKWIGFSIRCIVMGLFMGIWCNIFMDDWSEEGGRGGIIVLTLPLLLI